MEDDIRSSLPAVYRRPNVHEALEVGHNPDEYIKSLQNDLERNGYTRFGMKVITESVTSLAYDRKRLEEVGEMIERAAEEGHDDLLEGLRYPVRDLDVFKEPDAPAEYMFPYEEEHRSMQRYLEMAINIRYFYDLPIIQELEISEEILERIEYLCMDVSLEKVREEMVCNTCFPSSDDSYQNLSEEENDYSESESGDINN